MNPVQYVIANRGLGMTPGKLAAQVAHAATFSALFSAEREDPLLHKWLERGKAVVVLEARDDVHLRNAQAYIEGRGFKAFPVVDEGRTEVDPHAFTALGVVICDKDEPFTTFTFESFSIYRGFGHRPTPAEVVWRRLGR